MGAIVASAVERAPATSCTGFHDALRVGALLCLAGAIVARRRDPQDRAPAARRRDVAAERPRPHGRDGADEAAADGGGAAAGGARHRLPRLLALELPRRDDRGDRARGGDQRADPLPPLRLEARPLPRVPRRGVARASASVAEKAIAEDPERCLGAIADAYMAKQRADPHGRPLDPGADRGVRRHGDRGRRCASRSARCTTSSPT